MLSRYNTSYSLNCKSDLNIFSNIDFYSLATFFRQGGKDPGAWNKTFPYIAVLLLELSIEVSDAL